MQLSCLLVVLLSFFFLFLALFSAAFPRQLSSFWRFAVGSYAYVLGK
jgi:hypothetical protein